MTDFNKAPRVGADGVLADGIGRKHINSVSMVADEKEMLEATNLYNKGFLDAKVPLTYAGKQFRDDFVWGSGLYGTVWDLTTVVGSGTNAIKTGAAEGGISLLTTGTSANDLETTHSVDDYFGRLLAPMAEVSLSLETDLAGKIVKFGFSDNPMVEDGEYVAFMFDFSNDEVNWWHTSVDGTDATLGVGPTAGIKQRLRLEINVAGTAFFYVDDELVKTVTLALDADTGLYLFYGVKAIGAAAEVIEVGSIFAAWGY